NALAIINPLLLSSSKQRERDHMPMYAQTTGSHYTTAPVYTPIAGLSIVIPEGVGTMAIVILNVPFPYAEGTAYPGGNFGIAIDGKVSGVTAGFTYSEQKPLAFGRVPTTLVVGIPLALKAQTITGMWQNVRGSKVVIDSPATLTAILSS